MRALLLILALAGCAASAPPPDPAPDWRLRPAPELADARHLIVTVPLAEPEALTRLGAALAADHPVVLVAEWPLGSIDVHCYVFRVADGTTPEAAIAALGADARVRTVQPMQSFETQARAYPDELFDLQDGLRAMGVDRAHMVATGRGIRIGIVDTGVDAAHPDLAARMADARDFADLAGTPVPPERHGTAVAALVGADAQNAAGMVGIAPDAALVGLRGCWESRPGGPGRCSSFSLARALNFALGADLDVITLSLGGPDDPLLAELIEAAEARGIALVAARGEGPSPAFPASHPAVVSVAGPVGTGDAAAPSEDVISAAPGGEYGFYSGSSVAAAQVAGLAALAREHAPGLSAGRLRQALRAARREDHVDACALLAALGTACLPDA